MDIELKETGSRFDYPSSKTERVLNKWSNEEGEIKQESIRKAASQYAKYEVNNKVFKYIIAVVVVFLFVLLGFMIASVVLGVHITKEVSVKNGQLVAASGNNSVVKTSTVKYHNKITLNSPSSVIDSLTTVSVNVIDGMYQGVLQFEVVSYVFVPGKQLTFYGLTHQADVNPDGTVTLTNLVPYSSKRDSTSATTGNSLDGSSLTDSTGSSPVIPINTCEQLAAITDATASYQLTDSFTCDNLNLPLFAGQTFSGSFDGGKKTLTVSATSSGNIALFDTISGSIFNLQVSATFTGVGKCATFAVDAVQGSYFNKIASHSTISCSASTGGVAGGFFATVSSSSSASQNIQIFDSVSQVAITFNSPNSISGGFYGSSDSATSIVTFTYTASGSSFTTNGQSDQYGFLSTSTNDCQPNNNFCLVPVGSTNVDLPCCSPIEICPNNANRQNCDAYFCYACRDTDPRNSNKRSHSLTHKRDSRSVEVSPLFQADDQCY